VIDFCDQADRLAPNALIGAQVQNLKTLALSHCALLTREALFSFDAARNAVHAVRTVWRALCRAELGTSGFSRTQSRALASTCLQNRSQMIFHSVRFIRGPASQGLDAAGPVGVPALPAAEAPVDVPAAQPAEPAQSRWFEASYPWLFRKRFQTRLLARSIWGLRQARALTPWVSDIHLHLGMAYSESGHYKRAVAAFHSAARVQPGSADA